MIYLNKSKELINISEFNDRTTINFHHEIHT